MLQPRIPTRLFPLSRLVPSTSHRHAYSSSTSSSAVTTTPTTPHVRDHVPPPPIEAVNPSTSSATFQANRPDPSTESSALRTYKPRTPGVRHLKRPINDHLWRGRCYLPLTFPRKGQHIGGRNHSGQVRVRHRGGGAKRRIRIVDFSRVEPGKHTVDRIEYDPGRTAHLALVTRDGTGKKSYILAAQGLRAGDQVESFRQGLPQELIDSLGGVMDKGLIAAKTVFKGNCLPLYLIPQGTLVFNVGLRKGGRGQLCRGAGTFAMVLGAGEEYEKYAKEHREQEGGEENVVRSADGTWATEKEKGKEKQKEKRVEGGRGGREWKDMYINVKLKSGEIRRIHREACATIGTASNTHWNRRQLGKAGRSRWLGIRPTVRGVAMNAFEHPHGGGRGKSKGNVQPQSIWGQLTKGGFKTRKRRNVNQFVVVARPRSVTKKKKQEKKEKRKHRA
ncbi:MAG: hypothetical protein LQ351_006056 [Letrouitia transgressa]|nr:MAG: hypothetical protein LQ351_006056 [Letrouitia transgressa]